MAHWANCASRLTRMPTPRRLLCRSYRGVADMDVNGARFWLLADARHFPQRRHSVWDAACRTLRLASERTLSLPANTVALRTIANDALERVPRSVDPADSVVRWVEGASAE